MYTFTLLWTSHTFIRQLLQKYNHTLEFKNQNLGTTLSARGMLVGAYTASTNFFHIFHQSYEQTTEYNIQTEY